MIQQQFQFISRHKLHYYLLGIAIFYLILISNPIFTFRSQIYIKMFYVLIFVITITMSIYFVFESKQSDSLYKKTNESKLNYRFGMVIFVFVSIFVFFPILSQNYFFYDDYWSFAPITTTAFNPSSGRPIATLLSYVFSFINIKNIIYLRWFTVFGQIVFGLLLYKWVALKSQNNFKALVIAVSISFLSPFIDGICYGSTFPYSIAIAMAGLSVMAADYAIMIKPNSKLKAAWMLILSITCLFVSFTLYQIATPIVFLFLAIHLLFNTKSQSRLVLILIYAGIFIAATLTYTFVISMYASISGQSISGRSATIHSVEELKGKITYFYSILTQTSNQILVSLSGKNLFSYIGRINVNLFVKDSLNQNKYTITILLFACITLIKHLIKNRNVITFLMLIAFVPASFYSFLVILESSYVSYYVFPLAAILMLYISSGLFDVLYAVKNLIRHIAKRDLNTSYCAVFLALLVIFQGSLYVSQFWVYYNKSGYDFIKHTIENNIDACDRIHIYGVLYPGQGNIYSVFTVNTILSELNIDPSTILVTTSDNAYYVSIIQQEDYFNFYKNLTDEEKAFMDSLYLHDEVYGRFLITRTNFSADELKFLQNIFIKSNVIPVEDNNTTVVGLSWVY